MRDGVKLIHFKLFVHGAFYVISPVINYSFQTYLAVCMFQALLPFGPQISVSFNTRVIEFNNEN